MSVLSRITLILIAGLYLGLFVFLDIYSSRASGLSISKLVFSAGLLVSIVGFATSKSKVVFVGSSIATVVFLSPLIFNLVVLASGNEISPNAILPVLIAITLMFVIPLGVLFLFWMKFRSEVFDRDSSSGD